MALVACTAPLPSPELAHPNHPTHTYNHPPTYQHNCLPVQAKEAQHQADMKRLAQHYQAQLASAEGEIHRAKEAQVHWA